MTIANLILLTKEIIQGTTTLKMNHTWANWVCKETYISDAKEWKWNASQMQYCFFKRGCIYCFVSHANREDTRMDIFLFLVQLIE